jgi:hypothetical protein
MKMKKITSTLLAGLMIAGSFAIDAVSVSAVENKLDFEYTINAAGDAVITDYIGKDQTEVSIPGAIDGHKITAIGSWAFSYNEKIEKVTIPSSVKSIGYGAFNRAVNLKVVDIPESVTSIRGEAFNDCSSLYDIKLPSTLSSIDSGVFSCTAITQLDIPENVKTIVSNAFYGCKELESITLPDSVTTLGSSAFEDCLKLRTVKLITGLTEIQSSTFKNTPELSGITVPAKVRKIYSNAFKESGLKTIKLSKKVNKLGSQAFGKCFRLKSINVDSKNEYFSSKKGVLYNKKMTKLITYPAGKTAEKYTVNKKVKTIATEAFYGNPNLYSVKFNKGLNKIGYKAFRKSGLKKVVISKNVKEIEAQAFSELQNLKSVSIPKNIKSIGDSAFSDNPALTKIKFEGNSNLKLGWGVFQSCKSLRKINAPKFKKSYGGLCFACTKLKSVKISKEVKKIAREDYAECSKLNKVTIPATVKNIGKYAFGYVNYYDGYYDKNEDFVIKGVKNSAAHKYAKNNNIRFKKMK